MIQRHGKVIGPGNGAYVPVCKNKYSRKHAVCMVTVLICTYVCKNGNGVYCNVLTFLVRTNTLPLAQLDGHLSNVHSKGGWGGVVYLPGGRGGRRGG